MLRAGCAWRPTLRARFAAGRQDDEQARFADAEHVTESKGVTWVFWEASGGQRAWLIMERPGPGGAGGAAM